MNKEEFKKQMLKIQTAYNKKFNTQELQIWYEEFKTTNLQEFTKAIDKTIKEVKFMPKVADIRARIKVSPNDYYTDDPYRHLYKNNEWGEFVS